jgi:hypothetical protein
LTFDLRYKPIGANSFVEREFSIDLHHSTSTTTTTTTTTMQTVRQSTRTPDEAAMHCAVHVLRERVAQLLANRVGRRSDLTILEQLAPLHETLIGQLQLLQSTLLVLAADSKPNKKAKAKAALKHNGAVNCNDDEDDEDDDDEALRFDARLLFDERLLEALATDVGLALGSNNSRRNASAAVKARHYGNISNNNNDGEGELRRAAHEHRHQRSAHASAGVLGGGAYTTPAQLAARLRFLDRTGGSDNDAATIKVSRCCC